MIEVEKVSYDKDRGTEYYDIKGISNWDLKRVYQLLVAEKERSRIMEQGNDRGIKELREAIEPLAQEREWVRNSGVTQA